MVREVVAEGRTVFMSSHVMSEVQKAADRVGIIRDGRLASVDTVESLRASATRRVEAVFAAPVRPDDLAAVPGVSEVDVEVDGTCCTAASTGPPTHSSRRSPAHEVVSLTSEEPDLEEVFFDRYARDGTEVDR